MQIHGVFNWTPGKIGADTIGSEKKTSFFSDIADRFCNQIEDTDVPDKAKEHLLWLAGKLADTPGEKNKMSAESVKTIGENLKFYKTDDYMKVHNYFVGTSVPGPIGITIQGVESDKVFDKLRIQDPVKRENIVFDSVSLMAESESLTISSKFSSAASELISRVAQDRTSPDRAAIAGELSGVSEMDFSSASEKISVLKDSLKILKGDADSQWIFQKLNEYKSGKSTGASAFYSVIRNSFDKALQPIYSSLTQAVAGSDNQGAEASIMKKAKAMAAGADPADRNLILYCALDMLSTEPQVGESANAIIRNLEGFNSRELNEKFVNMLLDGADNSLNPDFKRVVQTGKDIADSKMLACKDVRSIGGDEHSSIINGYLNFLRNSAGNPLDSEVINTLERLGASIAKTGTAGVFFDLINSVDFNQPVTKESLLKNAGASLISSMPVSQYHESRIHSAAGKAILREISAGSGNDADYASFVLNISQNRHSTTLLKKAFEVLSKGISSVNSALIETADYSLSQMPESDYNDLKEKAEVSKFFLNAIADSATNDKIRLIAKGVMASVDVMPKKSAINNVGDAIRMMVSHSYSDEIKDLAGIFISGIKTCPDSDYFDKSFKSEAAIQCLNIIKDLAVDPAVSEFSNRGVDLLLSIEGRSSLQSPDRQISNSYIAGTKILENISQGTSGKPGYDVSQIGTQYLSGLPDTCHQDMALKADVAKNILACVEKHISDSAHKTLARSAVDVSNRLQDQKEYACKYSQACLCHINSDNREPTVAVIAKEAIELLGGMPVNKHKEKENCTSVAAAFAQNLHKNAANPALGLLGHAIQDYCENISPQEGYVFALKTFPAFIDKAGKNISSQEITQLIKGSISESEYDELEKSMKETLGIIYDMASALNPNDEKNMEIRQEDQYVVIGGVKLKKSGPIEA